MQLTRRLSLSDGRRAMRSSCRSSRGAPVIVGFPAFPATVVGICVDVWVVGSIGIVVGGIASKSYLDVVAFTILLRSSRCDGCDKLEGFSLLL
jgi:hypothetical protein